MCKRKFVEAQQVGGRISLPGTREVKNKWILFSDEKIVSIFVKASHALKTLLFTIRYYRTMLPGNTEGQLFAVRCE